MDALPILLNQRQLQLMQDGIHQALADLQQKQDSGWFDSSDISQKEQMLQTYGTAQYDEAKASVQQIKSQLNQELTNWQDGDTTRAVGISLNSYQVSLLRTGLEQALHHLDGSTEEDKALIEDLMEQLPEESPQEDSD